MNLIHFQGLNCYFDCMITTAACRGIKYEDALATLWSETDFAYNPQIHICTTKRLVTNLEALGQKMKVLHCVSPEDAEESLSLIHQEAFLLAGMDAFYIPWSPVYQLLHDPHYFVAQKENEDTFYCFDPTYGTQGMRITTSEIALHAFNICSLEEAVKTPWCPELPQEAQAVLRSHPQMKERLIWEINGCVRGKKKEAEFWGKYVEALINNRYLFKHYVRHLFHTEAAGGDPGVCSRLGSYVQFFDGDFFLQWQSIKNGLYKASLVVNNEPTLKDVCGLLETLLNGEIQLAKKITG